MQANVIWTGREYYSLENCVVALNDEGTTIDSMIVGMYENSLYRVGYRIRTDTNWVTRSVELSTQVFDEKKTYVFEHNGRWTCDGKPCPEFEDCIDVDIPLTPFTNTLPIRRLNLDVGQTHEIRVLYLDVLAREFKPVRQKYQRLSGSQYKYENVPNDFEAVITVDDDGIVVDYPQLFVRTKRIESKYGSTAN